MKVHILLALLCTLTIQSSEFIYPVAYVPDLSLFLIYQKTPHHIELWEWDYQTKRAEQVLLSRFTPAGLKILPSGKGFSFIDNGLIKVKQFIKRSPRTLDLDAPIQNIEVITWIDDENCYTSGQYQDKVGIFQIDYEGMVYPICLSREKDYMYPQKRGDMLFCIERDEYDQYRIVKTDYRPIGIEHNDFQKRFFEYWNHTSNREKIIDFGLKPIVFLTMISSQEGFVLSHPKTVSKKEKIITFSCYHIIQHDTIWDSIFLFTFSIPSSLIFTGNESRLYEALLPLLPCYTKEKILYVDSNMKNNLNIYCYEFDKNRPEKVSAAYGFEQFFGLLLVGNRIVYGGRLCDDPHTSISPKDRLSMAIIEGSVQVRLREYSL